MKHSFLFVVALSACQSAAVNQAARHEQDAIDAKTRVLLRSPVCEHSRPLGPDCGLLAPELASERFRQSFARARCQELSNGDGECRTRYLAMIAGVFRERYPAADPEVVAKSCAMPDTHCDDLAAYEVTVMDSHNAAVSDWSARQELAIEEQRLELQAAHAAELQKALVTGLYLLSRDRKCVSHAGLGDTTLTFCRD